MASIESTVRAMLEVWAGTLPLTGSPTITSEARPPEGIQALPTLSFWFRASNWQRAQAETVSALGSDVGVWDLGERMADLEVVYRCTSYEAAETFRDEFLRAAMLAALASNDSNTPVLRLPVTVHGIAREVCVYWGEDSLVVEPDPSETVRRNHWTVVHTATVTYPFLVAEREGAGTGAMLIRYQVSDGDVFAVEDHPDAP